MKKKILITGATDGIGFAAAKMLSALGQHVLLHGRSEVKLARVEKTLLNNPQCGKVERYVADLSKFQEVEALAKSVASNHDKLDVLINNAGVFRTSQPIAESGLDVRFVVNTLAPYLLTQRLLPLMDATARVVNVSSATQSPVNLKALAGRGELSDGAAYAQSKLALTMWSRDLALALKGKGPLIVAVNPKSQLGTKMVKEAYGVAGGDVQLGGDILVRAAVSDEFANATGLYFDNDKECFGPPHTDALDAKKSKEVGNTIETILASVSG